VNDISYCITDSQKSNNNGNPNTMAPVAPTKPTMIDKPMQGKIRIASLDWLNLTILGNKAMVDPSSVC
jgi:hypothetical protein